MRGLTLRRIAGLTGTALIAGMLTLGVPAGAQDAGWEATPGGWVSGPVEYLTTIEDDAGTAVDAVLHEDYLYLTTWRSFSIYDVSDPLDPQRVSHRHLGISVYNEQPQTNGEILLISRDLRYAPLLPGAPPGTSGGVLDIFDVTDKADPVLIATYESPQRDHLWTCVLDCSYAYSASGTILDLRDPSLPTKVGDWSVQAPYRPQRYHHVLEVAPGIVLTGSLPMYVLNARRDPTAPVAMASQEPATTVPLGGILMPESLPARVAWPDATTGRVAMVSMETPFSGPCTDQSGDFQTFLTRGWRGAGTFEPADRYQISENGTFTDGRPPANALGCSAYGLDVHPGFDTRGGSVALTFFEHGVRILDVDGRGRITERGGFLPLAGNSAQPRWLADDLLYVIDLHRGIDILRVNVPE